MNASVARLSVALLRRNVDHLMGIRSGGMCNRMDVVRIPGATRCQRPPSAGVSPVGTASRLRLYLVESHVDGRLARTPDLPAAIRSHLRGPVHTLRLRG